MVMGTVVERYYVTRVPGEPCVPSGGIDVFEAWGVDVAGSVVPDNLGLFRCSNSARVPRKKHESFPALDKVEIVHVERLMLFANWNLVHHLVVVIDDRAIFSRGKDGCETTLASHPRQREVHDIAVVEDVGAAPAKRRDRRLAHVPDMVGYWF